MTTESTPGGNIYDPVNGVKQDQQTAINRDARDLATKAVAINALDTANAFAIQIAQANSTAGAAKAIAENAESEVDEIKGPIDARLTAVETAAGYAPGDATDAAMANVAAQEGTQFRGALDAVLEDEFVERLPPALDEVRDEITDVRRVQDGIIPSTAPAALGRLMAAVASRDTLHVPMVAVGSSSVSGTGASTPAKRWVNRLAQMLYNTAPFSGGPQPVLTLSEAVAAPKPPRGHQFINAGVSGATSATYIKAATRPQIAGLAPRAMFHMVGSNDRSMGNTPAQFKANLESQIDQVDAMNTVHCTHVLIAQTDRIVPASNPAPWSEFVDAMLDIARERPQSVIAVDAATVFASNGIPGDDPLDLIGSDGLHPTDRGYALYAELLAHALDLPTRDANRAAGSSIRTSDTFNGANATSVVGRITDLGGGGATPAMWQGLVASAGITNNRLVRAPGQDAWFVGAPANLADYEVSFTVVTRPTASLYIDSRRAGGEQGSASAYRIGISPSGAILYKRSPSTGGSNAVLGTIIPYSEGDRIGLRCIGDRIALTINGSSALEVTDSELTGGGWWGLAGIASSAGWVLDDLVIKEIVS